MRSNRFHRWVLDLITKCYPRLYSRRHDPIIRPPRRAIRLQLDPFETREAPTNMSPVGPGAAWLASLVRPPESLPALVQSDLVSQPPSLQGIGENVVLPSLLRGGVGGEVFGGGPGGEGANSTTTPMPMPWTFTGVAFSANLDALPSFDSLLQDPLALDGLLPNRSHPPASLGGGAPEPHVPGSDAASAGDYGGSGAPSLSAPQQNAFFLDASLPTQPNMLLPPGALDNALAPAAGAPVSPSGSATNLLLPHALPPSGNNGHPATSYGSLG
jgi:hypothetical protein